MQLPEGFIDHYRLLCPFCGKEVATGHVDGDRPTGYHATPICPYWTHADTIGQYMMFVTLKMRSDVGHLERN